MAAALNESLGGGSGWAMAEALQEHSVTPAPRPRIRAPRADVLLRPSTAAQDPVPRPAPSVFDPSGHRVAA